MQYISCPSKTSLSHIHLKYLWLLCWQERKVWWSPITPKPSSLWHAGTTEPFSLIIILVNVTLLEGYGLVLVEQSVSKGLSCHIPRLICD